ncbi:MAG: radical SAM protein, partial [Oligoflexia bacterium]|nr:radical SAM protein [Oligoflexia bacterium]
TLVFGSHATFMPTYTLAHKGVDFIIQFEPELVIKDFCRKFFNDDRYAVNGLGYKNLQGQIVINPQYPFIENLDDLPIIDLNFLPKNVDYFNPIVRRMPYMSVSTSRGCPGKCIFCTAPSFDGHRVRFQSADYVLNMIKTFKDFGIREIYFRDDTFFVNKEREYNIFKQLIDNSMDISWIANARIGMIDYEIMEMAKRAGCHTIKFGIESGNQKVLNQIKKGYRIEQAYRVFEWTHSLGLNTHAHVMIGNPGDTLQTVEETIDFVKKLDPTTATFGVCTPYPGTPLFEEVAKIHPQICDGSASDLSRLHIDGFYNHLYCDLKREDLKKLVQKAYRKFYLRPNFLFQFARNQMNSVEDVKRIILSGTRVLDFMFRGV